MRTFAIANFANFYRCCCYLCLFLLYSAASACASHPVNSTGPRHAGPGPVKPGKKVSLPCWQDPEIRQASTLSRCAAYQIRLGHFKRSYRLYHRILLLDAKNEVALKGLASVHYRARDYGRTFFYLSRANAIQAARTKKKAMPVFQSVHDWAWAYMLLHAAFELDRLDPVGRKGILMKLVGKLSSDLQTKVDTRSVKTGYFFDLYHLIGEISLYHSWKNRPENSLRSLESDFRIRMLRSWYGDEDLKPISKIRMEFDLMY